MRRALVPMLMLAGCAHTGEPVVKTVTVDIPVAISCVPPDFKHAPPGPTVSKGELLHAPDGAARYQLLQDAWEVDTPRIAQDESVITACQNAAGSTK